MLMPFWLRVGAFVFGLLLIFANMLLPLVGSAQLTGPRAWFIFCFGIFAILAALYGGAGHYPQERESQ